MSIFENLQGLSLDTKALIVLIVLLWGLSELRHFLRHRADQDTIQRLQTDQAPAEQAALEAQRLPEVSRGGAVTLGEMVPRGADAGQHFVGAITNRGPQVAEAIHVSASLGTIKAEVVDAPRRLPPHGAAAVDVRLPFGFLTSADVMTALRAGEVLRLRVTFADGSPQPRAFEQCFAFAVEPGGDQALRADWVSRRVPCP